MVKLEAKVNKSKGTYISSTKAIELNNIIQNLIEDKTALEEEHFRMRSDYNSIVDQLDDARARAEASKQLLDNLQNEHRDQ